MIALETRIAISWGTIAAVQVRAPGGPWVELRGDNPHARLWGARFDLTDGIQAMAAFLLADGLARISGGRCLSPMPALITPSLRPNPFPLALVGAAP